VPGGGYEKAWCVRDAYELPSLKIREVFNEGATEVFARIATYRLDRLKGAEVSGVEAFGKIPSYEYAAHLVCRVVRDLDLERGDGEGLKLLGRAYFKGDFAGFNDALASLWTPSTEQITLRGPGTAADWDPADDEPPGTVAPYGPRFFRLVSRIGMGAPEYLGAGQGPTRAVVELGEDFGLGWPSPRDLIASVESGLYVDPTLAPTLLVADLAGERTQPPTVVAGDTGAPPAPVRCPLCDKGWDLTQYGPQP